MEEIKNILYESDTLSKNVGVVMTDGDDQLLMENYAAISDQIPVTNNSWKFYMYGKKNGQSFHEKHKKGGLHGESYTTIVVRAD